MRDLLRTYETIYLCISSVLSVTVWTLAPLIAEHWLRSKVLQPREMAAAIRIMGVAIAFQLPSGTISRRANGIAETSPGKFASDRMGCI